MGTFRLRNGPTSHILPAFSGEPKKHVMNYMATFAKTYK